MSGELDLNRLIAQMSPSLEGPEYAFCTLPPESAAFSPVQDEVLGCFREEEGMTWIVERVLAEATGVPWEFPCRRIVLEVHSSLEAVGFLAAVSARLTSLGIPSNVISAFFHDHLFVPSDRAHEALEALTSLSRD